MLPRSATTCERIKRPPVEHAGDMLEALRDLDAVEGRRRSPGTCRGSFRRERRSRNGVYRLGSNVSGAAMPPASQSRMRVSAVGSGCLTGSAPRTSRGSPAASAARAAAFMPRRKSRRVHVSLARESRMFILFRLVTGSVETRGARTPPRADRPGPRQWAASRSVRAPPPARLPWAGAPAPGGRSVRPVDPPVAFGIDFEQPGRAARRGFR